MFYKYIEYVLSIPKSLYLSLVYVRSFAAFRLPIVVRYNTIIRRCKGTISIAPNSRLKFGFGNVGIYDKKYQRSIWEVSGEIRISGNCSFGHGSRLCVTSNGVLDIGANFVNSAMMTIVCSKSIVIGSNVLTSWESFVMDTDWHCTYSPIKNEVFPYQKPIVIGDNVWVGFRSVILKGSKISNGCIIGANALVSGIFESENCVLVGNPARIVKSDLTMYRELQDNHGDSTRCVC